MAAGQGTGLGIRTGTRAGIGAAGQGVTAHLALSSAMEEAGSSGILRLTGMQLRDHPSSHTAAAGEGAPAVTGLRGHCGPGCGGRWGQAVRGL